MIMLLRRGGQLLSRGIIAAIAPRAGRLGDIAARLKRFMRAAVAKDASIEHIDERLGNLDVLLNPPIVVH